MGGVRRWAAVIALLAVAGMGCLLFFGGAPLIGGPLFAVALVLAAWRGLVAWRSRPDPYDLAKLWERVPEGYDPEIDQPEEDDGSGEHAFCHRCGHAVAKPHGRCPECGNALG